MSFICSHFRRPCLMLLLVLLQGADCLGKYVGDAERTLRLLFEDVSHFP
jgi:SpoVK/Ycf46/Vps4 family AAA+-type ATPase